MTEFRALAISVSSIALFAVQGALMHAQAAPSPPCQDPSMAISLALDKNHITVGQMPRAIVTIVNKSQEKICFPLMSRLYRIHISDKNGEAPQTELQRHFHGDFRSGDGPELVDGPVGCDDIAPGASEAITFDLTRYYDLSALGEYTVYIEILDELKGPTAPSVWLRTNTAQFEVLAPTQQP